MLSYGMAGELALIWTPEMGQAQIFPHNKEL